MRVAWCCGIIFEYYERGAWVKGWARRENPSAWRETIAIDKSSTSNPAWMILVSNPDLRSEKPAANRLIYMGPHVVESVE
jgi:hypothetical protein